MAIPQRVITTTISLDVALGLAEDAIVVFERRTVFGREHYGADADGNRGVWQDCVDEDEYEILSIIAEGVDDSEFSELEEHEQKLITAAVEEYLSSHDVEIPDEEEDDYDDYDDKPYDYSDEDR